MSVPALSPHDRRPPAPVAWPLLLAIAAVKLLTQLVAIRQFGYFRDELYYLASTRHLAWGYVDHPPLSIALLAGVRALFGDGLVALRAVPALAGAALVVLAGLFAARLGGGRFAQGLAALAVLTAPVYLATDHFYSMNALDQLAWPLALLLLGLDEAAPKRRWAAFGLVLGLGLLNKLSVLWLGAGIAVALLATPLRRTLRTPGPWLAGAIAAACLAPHVAWQVAHGWPTREFVRNATVEKMVPLSPLAFLGKQVLDLNPAAAVLWIAGLAWAFTRRGRAARPLAIVFLVVAAILLANPGSRPSYLAPAFPPMLAAGAVALTGWRGRLATTTRVALPVLLVALGAVALPVALPVLSPEATAAWIRRLGIDAGGQEHTRAAELPQHLADQFGWQEMATKVARAYHALPPADRARCAVFGQNYGEAGALDVLGRPLGLPPALSGHNAYWMWGPRGFDGAVVLVLGDDRETLESEFGSVERVDTIECRWCMPYERDLPLWLVKQPKTPLGELWPRTKHFI